MRRLVLATVAVAAALVPAAPAGADAQAQAAAGPRLSVQPPTVRLGDPVVIRGRRWPVFENCSRRVRLTLESVQNAAPIGVVRVRRDGRFLRRWTPTAAKIGPGEWTVVARMRCESGKDGSPFTLRRAAGLRIR
ncbi:MAG TPA: hypothetical protein VFR97_03900 [Capillimicrobium sp.]|nr:hypothetical protein [Capillimicrobium sp.]